MTTRAPISDVFVRALPETHRARFRSSDVEVWLCRALRDAREAFPGVAVSDEDFLRCLAGKAAALSDPSSALRKLRTTDLYLAFACSRKDSQALVSFEQMHFPKMDRTLARLKLSRATVDDLKSTLRERLFFAQGEARPLIGDYSGRGDLGSWLRSIAVRLAFKTKKMERRHVDAQSALEVFASDANPEMEYLRRVHSEVFEQALRRALDGLSARERNLLRQHYLDALNVDALGQLYRVHRATAARWVADARENVLDAVKKELAVRLSPSELESFLDATRGELGMRISRVLRASNTM